MDARVHAVADARARYPELHSLRFVQAAERGARRLPFSLVLEVTRALQGVPLRS